MVYKDKDPINHGCWNPPSFGALELGCRMLVFTWLLGPLRSCSLHRPESQVSAEPSLRVQVHQLHHAYRVRFKEFGTRPAGGAQVDVGFNRTAATPPPVATSLQTSIAAPLRPSRRFGHQRVQRMDFCKDSRLILTYPSNCIDLHRYLL